MNKKTVVLSVGAIVILLTFVIFLILGPQDKFIGALQKKVAPFSDSSESVGNMDVPVLTSYKDLLDLQTEILPRFRGEIGIPENDWADLYGFIPADSIIRSPRGVEMTVPKGWIVDLMGPYLDLSGLQYCLNGNQKCSNVAMLQRGDGFSSPIKDYDATLAEINSKLGDKELKDTSFGVETSETLIPNARVIKMSYTRLSSGVTIHSIQYYVFFNYLQEQENSKMVITVSTTTLEDIKKIEKTFSTLKIVDSNNKDARDLKQLFELSAVIHGIGFEFRKSGEYPRSLSKITHTIYGVNPEKFAYAYYLDDAKNNVPAYHIGINLENKENLLFKLDDCADRSGFSCPDVLGYGPKHFDGGDGRGCLGEEGLHCFDITLVREESSIEGYGEYDLLSSTILENVQDFKDKREAVERVLSPLINESKLGLRTGGLSDKDGQGGDPKVTLIKTWMSSVIPKVLICVDSSQTASGGISGQKICNLPLPADVWPAIDICGDKAEDTQWNVENGTSMQFEITLQCKNKAYSQCNGKENAVCTRVGCQFPSTGNCK